MKHKYRQRTLQNLCGELHSQDFDRREYALFQLRLMLRRASADEDAAGDAANFLDDLPRALRRIRLSDAEQRAIVGELSRLIASFRESRATAIWALREVSAELGLKPALTVISKFGDQLSDEAAYQVIAALEGWLGGDLSGRARLRADLMRCDPRPKLRGWAGSRDQRLAAIARAVLDEVEAVCRGYGEAVD